MISKKMSLMLLVFLSSFTLAPGARAEVTVVLNYEDVDSYPWTMINGEGIDTILLNMVDEAMPVVSFRYLPTPWKRCLYNMKAGLSDGCFYASFKKERLEYGYYPGDWFKKTVDTGLKLHDSSYSLYVLKGSRIKVSENMKIIGLRGVIAAPSGYSIGSDLKKAGYAVDAGSATTELNFEKLVKHRADAVAALTLNGNYILQNQAEFSDKIQEIKPALVSKPYYLMLSKQFVLRHPRLAKKIWNKIAEIRETEKFKKRAQDYLNQ